MFSGFWMQCAVSISIFLPLQNRLIISIFPLSGHVSNNRIVKEYLADKKIFEVRVNYISICLHYWLSFEHYLNTWDTGLAGSEGNLYTLFIFSFLLKYGWGLSDRMICIHKLSTSAVGLGRGDHSNVYHRKIFNRRGWFKWSLCFS